MGTARGFCTCKRDFPQRRRFHPPANATWHYLCDKPVLISMRDEASATQIPVCAPQVAGYVPTGTGWPVK